MARPNKESRSNGEDFYPLQSTSNDASCSEDDLENALDCALDALLHRLEPITKPQASFRVDSPQCAIDRVEVWKAMDGVGFEVLGVMRRPDANNPTISTVARGSFPIAGFFEEGEANEYALTTAERYRACPEDGGMSIADFEAYYATPHRCSLVPTCSRCGQQLPYIGVDHSASGCDHVETPNSDVELLVGALCRGFASISGKTAWGRWHAFNLLFGVAGNGFEWSDGRMVSVFEIPGEPKHSQLGEDPGLLHPPFWSAITPGSLISRVPTDVTDDWRRAALDYLEMIETFPGRKRWPRDPDPQETLAEARRIRSRLL